MSFIGTGKIKIATYTSGATFAARNFIDVGNASDFSYNFSETKKELLDYQDPAGGTAATVVKLDKVEGKMDLRVFSLANLALALWGTAAPTLGVTAITTEPHVITAGSFVPFDRIMNTTVAPVITKGTTTVGTADYVISPGGITIRHLLTHVSGLRPDGSRRQRDCRQQRRRDQRRLHANRLRQRANADQLGA